MWSLVPSKRGPDLNIFYCIVCMLLKKEWTLNSVIQQCHLITCCPVCFSNIFYVFIEFAINCLPAYKYCVFQTRSTTCSSLFCNNHGGNGPLKVGHLDTTSAKQLPAYITTFRGSFTDSWLDPIMQPEFFDSPMATKCLNDKGYVNVIRTGNILLSFWIIWCSKPTAVCQCVSLFY